MDVEIETSKSFDKILEYSSGKRNKYFDYQIFIDFFHNKKCKCYL